MPTRSLFQAHPKRWDVVVLLVVSAALLVTGLRLPILTVRQVWAKNTFSVVSGIQSLYQEKQYFLALIIFFFSLVFPIVKLLVLTVLWLVRLSDTQRQRILHWLSALGKWSMLDVFVVAVIIVTVKLGVLASAKPEIGIYYFGSSILLTMVATAIQNSLAKKPSQQVH